MAKNPINYRKMLTFLKKPLHFSVMVSFGASSTTLTNNEKNTIYINESGLYSLILYNLSKFESYDK